MPILQGKACPNARKTSPNLHMKSELFPRTQFLQSKHFSIEENPQKSFQSILAAIKLTKLHKASTPPYPYHNFQFHLKSFSHTVLDPSKVCLITIVTDNPVSWNILARKLCLDHQDISQVCRISFSFIPFNRHCRW